MSFIKFIESLILHTKKNWTKGENSVTLGEDNIHTITHCYYSLKFNYTNETPDI